MSNDEVFAAPFRSRAPEEWVHIYDTLVARLRSLGIGVNAPRAGDLFPDFMLPDHRGRFVSLGQLTAAAPLVLSFHRGRWCRYCFHELEAWAEALPLLADAGGTFAAATPEVGGRAADVAATVGSSAAVLCDIDNGLALNLGIAFHLGPDLAARYHAEGLDLGMIYGSNAHILPVPATFVIDRDRIVRFAFADVDFRVRADPREVIAAVAALRH